MTMMVISPLADRVHIALMTGATAAPAPMAGGPFVASSGEMNLTDAEPRAKDESWNEHQPKTEEPDPRPTPVPQ